MASVILTVGLIIFGLIAIVIVIVGWLIFGRLIMLQIRRWRLARKGYVEVEHISETNLRQYIIMKPSNRSFDFFDGFFHYDPEAVTRGERNILKDYRRKEIEDAIKTTEEELLVLPDVERANRIRKIKSLYNSLKKFKFDKEALTYRYGMPVITYYGDKPDPVMFRNLTRQFPSTFIKDMYLRLLLTQRYQDFRKFIIFGLIIGGVIGVSLLLILMYLKGLQNDLSVCHNILNNTINSYTDLVNKSAFIKAQGSMVVM